jgi:hypothetical protein
VCFESHNQNLREKYGNTRVKLETNILSPPRKQHASQNLHGARAPCLWPLNSLSGDFITPTFNSPVQYIHLHTLIHLEFKFEVIPKIWNQSVQFPHNLSSPSSPTFWSPACQWLWSLVHPTIYYHSPETQTSRSLLLEELTTETSYLKLRLQVSKSPLSSYCFTSLTNNFPFINDSSSTYLKDPDQYICTVFPKNSKVPYADEHRTIPYFSTKNPTICPKNHSLI